MPTIWTIAIDWNRTGNYDHGLSDVTSKVTAASWFLGMQKTYQEMADSAVLRLTLDNSDQWLSPENTSSPLNVGQQRVSPFRQVRVQSTEGGTTRTHWLGWIETIEPTVGSNGPREVTITANGPMQFYKAAETNLPLQENQRSDAIIDKLIREVVMPPAMSAAWVLDHPYNSALGLTTRLADTSAAAWLQPGKKTLGMVGDNWVRRGGHTDVTQDSYDVYRAIGDVTAAERGRFFFNRDGWAVFYNRHHLLDQYTPSVEFNNSMQGMVYTYAGLEQLKNEVIVVCHPRQRSETADHVLWELGESIISVAAGQKRTLYIKYQDESGNRIGGKDLTINDLTFEQGSATVTLTANANGAELVCDNTGGAVDAIITKCVIKGRKITDFGVMEAKAVDGISQADYGRRTLRINLPSVDNLADAQAIAQFELNRRKTPRGEVSTLTLKSHGKNGGDHHEWQLAASIGSVIRIVEDQTDHARNYYVIGEAHKLTAGATLWETTWYLEPTPVAPFPWKLGATGRAELGTTTYLTY